MTQTILRLDASARYQTSMTRQRVDRVIGGLEGRVIHRDLAATPPSFVTEAAIGAYFTPADDRTDAQRATLTESDAAVAELMEADTIVIGMPIYNFGVPAALKAWVDLVARVGVTFRYGPDGPEGLLKNKRAIIVVASGGTAPMSGIDFATPWLKHCLGFIGIDDVTILTADDFAGAEAA